MKLLFHDYKYYPYEHHLARREAMALFGERSVTELSNGLELQGKPDPAHAARLVYFSEVHTTNRTLDTVQAKLERAATAGQRRQSTRYSVHGLHEYKGKFNPQIAKALLNIFSVGPGDRVLDPFCGSGTTLVECAQLGATAVGMDLNPLAEFIANAKLLALRTPAQFLRQRFQLLRRRLDGSHQGRPTGGGERNIYLRKWFNAEILEVVEHVRACIVGSTKECAPVFLAIASNLLRDYSLQDPNDLRIRRRTSPLPSKPYIEAFTEAYETFLKRLSESQEVLGHHLGKGRAVVADVGKISSSYRKKTFDAALTSPPYAMALPYIDTQRLSLVWLGLISPSEVLPLEAMLIGSREMRGRMRRELEDQLARNHHELPDEELNLCRTLRDNVGTSDGFRRQAVPTLLYRYFRDMLNMFRAVRIPMKDRAPFGLVVGHNHTVLNGKRYDLNTPQHLASLAQHAGWEVLELIPLQTYQRYGYHMANAVSAETLIVLRNHE